MGEKLKEKKIVLLLSALGGCFGMDRFYLGHIVLGIFKLLTFGGLGIWWIIDIILIAANKVRDADGNELI
jgi:TM2 domain-containing membrane protein YozV